MLHVPVVLRLLLVALVLTATAAAGVGAPVTAARAATATSWPMAGGDAANSRANAAETLLSPATAGGLQRQWSAPLGATHAATPAVVDGTVYVPDAAGSMLALDAATGQTRWSRTIASYTGVAGDTSRASPAVVDGRVVFGTRRVGTGAKVVAARASDGAPLWVRVVDTHRAARITGAPVVAGGVVYVGVSSDEEVATTCCTWRGSVVALDAATGAVLWRTMTVPEGYTGGAVWSSTPVVNAAAGLLYVTTGNNYTVPAGVCSAPGQTGCSAGDPRNYVDAVLALRLVDGSPAWALRTMSADVWTKACRVPGAPPCGPDFDFGAGANLFTATIGGVARQLVGAGQKSGIYWAVDAVTGELVWQRRVGPGGDLGGIQWGTAADGRRIYVAVANSENAPYQLPSGQTITGGSYAALDPATGAVLWQTADPSGAEATGFVSAANGVVYAGSEALADSRMHALDAATGRILWSHAAGGSVTGGAAVVGGRVYWAAGAPAPALHAFAAPSAPVGTPAAPTAVAASASTAARSATLTWAPPASDGGSAITGYRVARNGTDANGTGPWSTTVAATARTFTFTTLRDATYDLTVQAVNARGAGEGVTRSVTLGTTTPPSVPSAPTAVSAAQVGTSQSATLTWAPPTSTGGSAITGYRVSRNGTDTNGTGPWSTTVAATARSFTFANLAHGSTYTFTVAALNATGTGPGASAPAVTPRTVPGAPVIGTAVSGASGGAVTAQAAWSAPASTGGSAITGYRVTALRMSSTGTVLGTTVSAVQPATARSLSMTLPQTGTYRFTVQAINAVGAGAQSARSNAVTGR